MLQTVFQKDQSPNHKVSDQQFNQFTPSAKWQKWKDRQVNRELTVEELADSFYVDDGMGYIDDLMFPTEEWF